MAEGQLKQFGTEKYLPKYIKLTSGGFMALKTRPVILRIHASKKKQRHEGIYSELLLFLPWKNETDLFAGQEENCVNLFNQKKKIIENNKRAIYPNSEMIDCMKELLESSEDNRPIHLSDDIDATGQQENIDDQEQLDQLDPLDTSELPIEESSKGTNKKPDGCPYKPVPISTRDTLIKQASTLSFSQRVAFDKVVTFCKSVMRAEKSDQTSIVPPPLLIVHGKFNSKYFINYFV